MEYILTKKFAWRLDIVRYLILWDLVPGYILENIQNNLALVMIPTVLIYPEQNVSILFVNNIYIRKY